MRAVVVFVMCVTLMHPSRGLSQQVTIACRDCPIGKVIARLRAQTGYEFLYDPALIKRANRVTLQAVNAPLRAVLDSCTFGQPVTYKIVDHAILFGERITPSSAVNKTYPIRISGFVQDTSAQPMAGVSVEVRAVTGKRSVRGVLTDDRGFFSLPVTSRETQLAISSAGYRSRLLTAGQLMDGGVILLQPNQENMQAIIVNKGYYNTTQEFNTGDLSTVKATLIAQQTLSDPLLALQGLVPGLSITRQSGLPGAAVTAMCRGQNSIQSGNDLFYIVDGVPYPSDLLRTTDNQLISSNITGGSPLAFLAPADIESMTVLKDADALAIYGSQGANGALLITTKKGRPGPLRIDADISQGVVTDHDRLPLLDTRQYLTMRNEALANDGLQPGPDDIDLTQFDPARYTDWQKTLNGVAGDRTNAHLAISGGSRDITFLVSGTQLQQGDVFPGSFKDTKQALHVSLTRKTGDGRFNATINGEWLLDDNRLPGSDLTPMGLTLPPNAPALQNAGGSLQWQDGLYNPLAYTLQPFRDRTHNLVLGSTLSYRLLPGLEARLGLGLTDLLSHQSQMTPIVSQDPYPGFILTGNVSYIDNHINSWIIEPGLNFSHPAGPGKLSLSIGGTLRRQLDQGKGIDGAGYTSDSLLGDLQAAPLVYTSLMTWSDYRYEGVYGRIGYNWADKYILNFTGRRDGSSRFGPDRQYATFAAIGTAWLFSKEPWVQHLAPGLSFGKLRASYGTTGNDQIGDYGYLNLYSPNFYTYLGSAGLAPTSPFEPNYSWEINKKLEAALELGLLHDRLQVTVSYFRDRSDNQLLDQSIASITGFLAVTANLPAIVENEGWEAQLATAGISAGPFRWTGALNLTIPHNKLVRYPGLSQSPYAGQYIVGASLSAQRLFDYRGVDPATGLYQFATAGGKLTSAPNDPADLIAVRGTGQSFYGGLVNTLTWKGFSLAFVFVFVQQTAPYLPYLAADDQPGAPINQTRAVLARWHQPGEQTDVQKFSNSTAASSAYYDVEYSTRSIRPAGYIRLKSCSLSYALPAAAIRHAGLKNCRFYLQGQDLLTITDYYGLDPETQSTNLPPLRIVAAGIQLTL